MLSRKVHVGEREELISGPLGLLGLDVNGRAFRENLDRIGETSFECGQVAETGCRLREAERVYLCELLIRFTGLR